MMAVDTSLLVYAHRREVAEHAVAAICISHGVDALLTRDRDFSLFPELRVENPFV